MWGFQGIPMNLINVKYQAPGKFVPKGWISTSFFSINMEYSLPFMGLKLLPIMIPEDWSGIDMNLHYLYLYLPLQTTSISCTNGY